MIGDPNQPQQQNPLAGLMSLLGPQPQPAAPQQQTSPGPQQAGPPPMPAPQPQQQPQAAMNPLVQGLMGQAQGAMNNPMGQPVPQGAGLIDALKHPLVAGIIKALATAAQSYGWTAMMPQEREERTQMQQQKAETLSRLAETGAYESGNLAVRQQGANTRQEQADTQQQNVQSEVGMRDFQQKNQANRTQLLKDANQWKQDIAQGKLGIAQQSIDQRASQFEQKFQLASKQFGLDQAKVELMGEGMAIKQGMLDLARTALSQKGTVEGAQAASKIQQFKIDHPIMSQIMDMSDLDQLVGGAAGAGIPGVSSTPTPAVPQGSTTPTPQAKAAAKGGSKSGTHYYFDAQGNQVNAGQ